MSAGTNFNWEMYFSNFTANKVTKMECSDLENDTNKNGTNHRNISDEQSQQVTFIDYFPI